MNSATADPESAADGSQKPNGDGHRSSTSPARAGSETPSRYIQATGDKSPVHYLAAKYLGDEAAARDQALGQVQELLQSLPAMLAAAGLATKSRGGQR